MAIAVDRDQQWLLDCLTATLNNNQEIRSFAEASLQQAALQPGFGVALAKVAVNRDIPFGLRQLAAVLLKQFIKQHWKEDEVGFIHPVVSPEDKASVRQLLTSSLDDPHGKIRTAIGMAVSFIANYDWPEDWPDLLPFLLKLISEQTNIYGVHGALRCLTLISDDLDDRLVPQMVPVLFPHLHAIVSSPNLYEKNLRAKAIVIVHSCISVLGSISGVYKTETKELVRPMLKSWIGQFSVILQTSVKPDDPDDWNIRLEVLKCLKQFVQNFPTISELELAVVIAPLWKTFASCLEVYQLSLIQCSEDLYLESFNSDGTERSLETFAIQLFEFLLTVVGNSRLVEVIRKTIWELFYYTISFMQMTEEQVRAWSTDVNQYVAAEDNATYCCRVSGSVLLEEAVNVSGREGVDTLIEVVEKHFKESCDAKLNGSANWWKVHEACLFALCSTSEPLLETQSFRGKSAALPDILNLMLIEAKAAGVHEYPFIHARALTTVAKFSSMISQSLCEDFVGAATLAVCIDVPPLVKVGACRTLSQLLPKSNSLIIKTRIVGLLSSLSDLLNQASEETLHLVLETLQAAVKAGHELLASVEPVLSPIILNTWVQHVSDPFVSIDALEVLEAIKNAPGCMWPLASRVLPTIGSILEQPQHQPAGLVAASLDLVAMIVKNAPADLVKAVFDSSFSSVIRIILQSDDHSEMQNATQCLAAIVSGGKQDLLLWGGDTGLTMRSLLDACSKLLDPHLESCCSLFVSTYIVQLLLHFPSEMSFHVRELIDALVKRMQSCGLVGLRSSIIVIFARLVHLNFQNIDQFINLMLTIPANGDENSFTYVMSVWTSLQGEIQGAYQIKVTTTALALLLSTRHVELAKIKVQGHLVKSHAGITTRSKAKLAPDRWTVIPLPDKIFALLTDTLIEIQEQVLPDNDEDSDWEEVQECKDGAKEDILLSGGLSSTSELRAEHLDVMARVFNESDEGDDDNEFEDDLLKGVDPLYEINLLNYLADFFTKLSNSENTFFVQLFGTLSPAQKNAIKTILDEQTPA